MSDLEIEKDYEIERYPTKIIISPDGKMIKLPSGYDWESLVKDLSLL